MIRNIFSRLSIEEAETRDADESRVDSARNSFAPVMRVKVPNNVRPGDNFPVYARGRVIYVQCPHGSTAGQHLRISIPEDDIAAESVYDGQDDNHRAATASRSIGQRSQIRPPDHVSIIEGFLPQEKKTRLFEVEVPRGVDPGASFALMADGVRVLVTCPFNASPGQTIRFGLPCDPGRKKEVSGPASIRLKYDKDGWTRRLRVSDMKFQWIRVDEAGDASNPKRFDMQKSAYVRKLQLLEAHDGRYREGVVSLEPASEAAIASSIANVRGKTIVSYADIANAQVQPFEEKAKWFQETCRKLKVEWGEGHMQMRVRRDHLLGDSIEAVMSLGRKDLRKIWRFQFIGEEAIDAGGLKREWFELVTTNIFDPDIGLWESSATNQMNLQINPNSALCHEDHLACYRFLGRVIGKALFDHEICSCHMVAYVYKHLLGWPVTLADLEDVDREYFNNLKQLETLVKSGEDLSTLCLDFTTNQEVFGLNEEIELVQGGANIGLTNENFPEYLEACLKYKLLHVVHPQLNELILGFFDVIPEPLLTVFDFQELELILCGLPDIDLEDWKQHTEYSGECSDLGAEHPVCQWFWDVVANFNHEMKARLLQFVTGTSGVPSRGFGVLQGNDGNIRKFTIHGVTPGTCMYPRAHTCFNRIDLPLYGSKTELEATLRLAVTMCATGFDIE